ncbi:hypothetical protein PISL3812_00246 [Talaromyces islandicus]|uniref:DUF7924 domain-containing protein n=1 Tax=Talaromyces islandicus TaxID=28573 RepID=A0A0U1LIS3_TALIS|nr:hypothetical protein PISL3812_00246 [Talaromyces islandicus]
MKRAQSSALQNSHHDERPAKVPRRESLSIPSPNKEQEEQIKAQHPPSPKSNSGNPVNLERQTTTTKPSLTNATTRHTAEIFDWIPAPSEIVDDERSSARDAKSSAYKAVNYVTILETKGCFMRQSSAGPHPEDIALCERLLDQPIETPQGTLFDDEYITDFHNSLQNRSEARLFIDLHPLLMPSAENQFIQGKTRLKNVIDGYNDLWVKTEPIYGPKPQPDHARGLRWSTFSENQRRKLGIKPDEKSLYTAQEDMYFPYVTAEIKCGNQALELADRQNMHSMCIAMRAVVSLSRAAGYPERVHQRILGFSMSHDLEGLRIYGYYPEIDNENTSYFRWPVAQLNIWTKEDRWACYRFMENLDREFLPIHIDRLMQLLEEVPDLEEYPPSADVDIESRTSRIELQEHSRIIRQTASSQSSRGLQPELRLMVQTLQQQVEMQARQLADQREREEKRDAEQKAREAEHKAREDKLLAQLEHLTRKLIDN